MQYVSIQIFYDVKTKRKSAHSAVMDAVALRDVFANNLRFFRKNHNPPFTQERLSELVGKNQNYIGLLEKGKSSPPLEMIALIADTLDVAPSALLETNASPDNIQAFDKDAFIESLSDTLLEKFRATLKSEIRKSFG